MDWIISLNLPFNFVEKDETKKYSKLNSLSVDTLMIYLNKVYEVVILKISESLPDKFGIIFDGWTDRHATYYLAMYASFPTNAGPRNILMGCQPLQGGTFTALAHADIIRETLSTFNKSLLNVTYLVGDNCSTNTALSTMQHGKFRIGKQSDNRPYSGRLAPHTNPFPIII
jgi:hypothetical protein